MSQKADSHPERPLHPRRIVYIYRKYQRDFILKFCLVALGAMAAASVLLYCFSRSSLTATYGYHHLALKTTAEAILPALLMTNALVLLFFVAATVAVTLYMSHRIGGPLFRLGKNLEAVGKGDVRLKVNLREGDQLVELAKQFNTMTEGLNHRVKEVQGEVNALWLKVERDNCDPHELKRDIQRLHHSAYRLFETE